MGVAIRELGVAGLLYRGSLVGLPAVAVAGVAGSWWLGQRNLAVLGLYLAVPMVAAPVVVGLARSPGRASLASDLDWRIPSILFHLSVSALVGLVVVSEVRPIGFYAGVAFVYALVFVFIVTAPAGKLGRAICLYHGSVAVLLVIFSVTLNYELFVGRTDLTGHLAFTNAIIETGRTRILSETYEPFLLWHVLVAGTYRLFGGWVSPHTTTFLLGGLTFGAGVPAIYALTRRLYPDDRAALLSTLMLGCFPLYLFYGMYSIPRSVTSILFLVLLVVLTLPPTGRTRAVSLLLVASIVIYHPVSIPFVMVILAALFVVERILGTRTRIADGFVLGATILITAVYWLYRADFLTSRVLSTAHGMFTGPSPSTAPSGVVTDPWLEVANYLPYSFLLFFALVGILFWYRDGRSAAAPYAAVGAVTLGLVPLVLPGPTLLLDSLAGVNVGRFGHYGYMFVAVTAGVGAAELLRRGGLAVVLVLLVLTSGLAFTAVSNDFVASDNPVVERPFYTFYLSENERQAFATIETVHDGQVGSDRPTCRYLSELHGAHCETILAEAGEEMFAPHDGVIVRDGEREKRPLQFSQYVFDEEFPTADLASRNTVYDSGDVSFHR